ncbi:expressed unknown protein [Seminavis robusta]|nr:expressed unknown protein [Seminavis robusta]|eukprot:Sro601_g173430.1 n/a (334) ;mRNA; f:71-1072
MTLKDRKPGEAAGLTASCELLMKDLDPRICHVPMRAWTEWTPRVVPSDLRLSAIVNNLIEGMEDDDEDAYDGPDIVPLAWLVPDPYLDVHMIAIAANNTLVEDDDAFLDEMYWGGRRLEIADQHNGGPISRSRERPFSADDRKNADSAKRPAQTTVDPAESSSHSRRTMIIEEPEHVAAGSGWRLVGAPHGFCDGSAQSRCRRTSHNPCLLANFNHFKGSIMGTVKTGWLKFLVAGVHHGIVLARLEFGHMKLPDDFVFDLSVNGQVKSYKPEELSAWSTTIVDGLTVYPLVLESKFPSEKSPGLPDSYDVAIRIQSQQNPNSQVRISHVYFA